MHGPDSFLKDIKPVISPTYLRRLKGEDISSISTLSIIEFAVSLILRCHYILWSSPFQTVNPKVNNPYIMVEF